MADQYSEAQWQPEPAGMPEGLAVVENDDLSEEVEAVTPQNAGPGPQLTDEQDPDLMDDEVIETVVDQDEQLAERARRKARLRLGTAVSTTSLVDMARQAREEAKLAQRSPFADQIIGRTVANDGLCAHELVGPQKDRRT